MNMVFNVMTTGILIYGDEVLVDFGCGKNVPATVRGFPKNMYVGRLPGYPDGDTSFFPGVYRDQSIASVEYEDGTSENVHVTEISLADQIELYKRVDRSNAKENEPGYESRIAFMDNFLGDLPETPYYEGDLVSVKGRVKPLVVSKISWNQNGVPKGYTLADNYLEDGWVSPNCGEAELELRGRGPVWRYMHDMDPMLETINDIRKFHKKMGLTKSVQHPDTKLFAWTRKELTGALEKGLVHDWNKITHGFDEYRALIYDDLDVGKDVGDEMLDVLWKY